MALRTSTRSKCPSLKTARSKLARLRRGSRALRRLTVRVKSGACVLRERSRVTPRRAQERLEERWVKATSQVGSLDARHHAPKNYARRRPSPPESSAQGLALSSPVGRAAAQCFDKLAEVRRELVACRATARQPLAAAVAAASRLQSGAPPCARTETAKLAGLLTTADRAVTRVGSRPAHEMLTAVMALDAAYHRLCYAAGLCGVHGVVPPPHTFFKEGGAWEAGGAVSAHEARQFLVGAAGETGVDTAVELLDWKELGGSGSAEDNPLLALLQARWRESVVMLGKAGVVPSSLNKCGPTDGSNTMKGRDPLAASAVHSWRDSIRVWACHSYSYAVPNEAALGVLSRHAPLVEVGAGTGYWASILQNRGAKVYAYDCRPTPVTETPLSASVNEYHGLCRSWTTVTRGGPEVAGRHPGASLFLCYPPPPADHSPCMASCALRHFAGDVVCVVGEWGGDTGSRRFEHELSSGFVVQECVALPNWGDTSASLTVWRRAGHSEKGFRSPLSCWGCGKSGDAKLWRCRFSHDATFCSKACASLTESSARHRANLAVRMVVSSTGNGALPLPHFGDSQHYRCAAERTT